MKKKLLSLLLVLVLAAGLAVPALAAEESLPTAEEGSVVVLYTNDIHCYMDNDGLRYSDVAGLKAYYEAAGAHVLLLDAGDHIQGTASWAPSSAPLRTPWTTTMPTATVWSAPWRPTPATLPPMRCTGSSMIWDWMWTSP